MAKLGHTSIYGDLEVNKSITSTGDITVESGKLNLTNSAYLNYLNGKFLINDSGLQIEMYSLNNDVKIDTNKDQFLFNKQISSPGGLFTGDLKIEHPNQPRLILNQSSDSQGNGPVLEFSHSTQSVQIRHEHYDAHRPPFGLIIEGGETWPDSSGKAYLEVEGEIFADGNRHVYHEGHIPTPTEIGLGNVNNVASYSIAETDANAYKQEFLTISGGDLNDIRQTGWYRSTGDSNSWNNLPEGATGAFTLFIETIQSNNPSFNYLRQTLNSYRNTNSWTRVDFNGVAVSWSDWELNTDSSILGDLSGLQTSNRNTIVDAINTVDAVSKSNSSNKLNLSGGTMTGSVDFQNHHIQYSNQSFGTYTNLNTIGSWSVVHSNNQILEFNRDGWLKSYRQGTLYGTLNKPNAADVGLGNVTNVAQVNKSGDVMTGTLSAPALFALNPNNDQASVALQFNNDMPVLRYGGSGNGAGNGFQIQGVGDSVKFFVSNSGQIFEGGTNRVYSTGNKPTPADVSLGNVNNWGASNSVTSGSGVTYATSNAVKQAYDKALEAFAGTDSKWALDGTNVVSAVENVKLSSSTGSFLPTSNNTGNLGNSSNIFNNAYINQAYVSRVNLTATSSDNCYIGTTLDGLHTHMDFFMDDDFEDTFRFIHKRASNTTETVLEIGRSGNGTGNGFARLDGNLNTNTITIGNETLSNTDSSFRIQNSNGYIDLGPKNNSGLCHIYTDRNTFYFNKELSVNGAQVYHTNSKPTKSDVGLSNVDNFATATIITDSSSQKFATASLTAQLNVDKLGKTETAVDSDKLNGVASSEVATANTIVKRDSDGDIATNNNINANNWSIKFDDTRKVISFLID